MEIYKKLVLTSCAPQEVAGNEGIVDGIGSFIRTIIQKIVDGFKRLWNAVFGAAKTKKIADVTKEIKEGKPKDEVTVNKAIAWAVPDNYLTDESMCNKHIVAYSEALIKFHKIWLDRMKKHYSLIQSGIKNAIPKITVESVNEEIWLSHRSSIKINYTPKDTMGLADAIEKVSHGMRDFSNAKGFGGLISLDPAAINKTVSNYMSLFTKRKETQDILEKINDAWGKEFKSLAALTDLSDNDFKEKFNLLHLESNVVYHMGDMFDNEFDMLIRLCTQLQKW